MGLGGGHVGDRRGHHIGPLVLLLWRRHAAPDREVDQNQPTYLNRAVYPLNLKSTVMQCTSLKFFYHFHVNVLEICGETR